MSSTERVCVRRFGSWLALIAVGGFALRLAVVVTSRNEAVGGDGFAYNVASNNNAAGHWFVGTFTSRPDAVHPPLWTLVLTGWAAIGQQSIISKQILCCLIGAGTVAFVGLAARRIAGDHAGLVAAAIAAMYAGFWLYERALLSETLLFPLIALMIIAAYGFHDDPTIWRAALIGALCGLLAMTRSEEILIFPFLAVPLILTAKHAGWKSRISWLVVASVMTVLLIAPWTIYNLGRFQKPIFLSSNEGGTVVLANCNGAYYGSHVGWYDIRCFPPEQAADPSVANGVYLHIALHYTEHHLSRLPFVVFAREGRAFGYWNPFQQTHLDNQWQAVSPILGTRSTVWAYDLRLVSYWILLVPAIGGCVLLRRRRIPLYPLFSFVLTVAVTVATAYGETRYRAAAEVPLVILAAIGIEAVHPASRSTRDAEDTEHPVTVTSDDVPQAVVPSPRGG